MAEVMVKASLLAAHMYESAGFVAEGVLQHPLVREKTMPVILLRKLL